MVSDRSLNYAILFFVSLFAVVFVMGLTGCSAGVDRTNVEIIQDMMEQPAVKAQDVNPHNKNQSGMRVPPEGTAAMNREVYLYKGDLEGAIKNLTNPETVNEEFLKLGEKHYKNYCYVCHGEQGRGDGPVAEKFTGIKPPALLSDKVRAMKDAQIFHIITDSQGVMGAYINQMPWSKDRWAVVSYVRKLQAENK